MAGVIGTLCDFRIIIIVSKTCDGTQWITGLLHPAQVRPQVSFDLRGLSW